MNPDAIPGAAVQPVPFVRVVERERAPSVKVWKLAAGNAGGDVVDADRRLLVAFAHFLDAALAEGRIVILDQPRYAAGVLVDVDPRARGVHDDGVTLRRRELQQMARHAVRGRQVLCGAQPRRCLCA